LLLASQALRTRRNTAGFKAWAGFTPHPGTRSLGTGRLAPPSLLFLLDKCPCLLGDSCQPLPKNWMMQKAIGRQVRPFSQGRLPVMAGCHGWQASTFYGFPAEAVLPPVTAWGSDNHRSVLTARPKPNYRNRPANLHRLLSPRATSIRRWLSPLFMLVLFPKDVCCFLLPTHSAAIK
jgi:hypothetical protein